MNGGTYSEAKEHYCANNENDGQVEPPDRTKDGQEDDFHWDSDDKKRYHDDFETRAFFGTDIGLVFELVV